MTFAEETLADESSVRFRFESGIQPDVILIGVSTGGPNTLATLLKEIPATFPVPIAIVQHMPPTFTKLLASRLDQASPLCVSEARDGEVAVAGSVYIAPGSHHLRVARCCQGVQLHLDDGQPENSCRPAVDVLFRSAAMSCGSRAIGVVLTGMGSDGLSGVRDLKSAGAHVMAQDEETSVVWGMPGSIVENGLADCVLPIDKIASELLRLTATRIAVKSGP